MKYLLAAFLIISLSLPTFAGEVGRWGVGINLGALNNYKMWTTAFIPAYADTSKFVYTSESGSKLYLPLEFTTSITPSWFWTGDILIHPSVDEIVGWFRTAQAYHGNLLLNVGPGMDGKIPSYNVDYLTKAGNILINSGELK